MPPPPPVPRPIPPVPPLPSNWRPYVITRSQELYNKVNAQRKLRENIEKAITIKEGVKDWYSGVLHHGYSMMTWRQEFHKLIKRGLTLLGDADVKIEKINKISNNISKLIELFLQPISSDSDSDSDSDSEGGRKKTRKRKTKRRKSRRKSKRKSRTRKTKKKRTKR